MKHIYESIELLMKEGINYLDSKIELLDSKNKYLQDMKFNEFIEKNASLIAGEEIRKLFINSRLSCYALNITNIFDELSMFINEKYEKAMQHKLASSKELKDIFKEYCNMLKKNIAIGELHEMFEEWCADGEIFYSRVEEKKISNHSAGIEVLLMKHYSEQLDKFTEELCRNIEQIEKNVNEEEENEAR